MPVIVTGRTRPGPGLGAADEGEQHRARQAKPQAPRPELIPGNVPYIPQPERPGMATPNFHARWNDMSRAATMSQCPPLLCLNKARVHATLSSDRHICANGGIRLGRDVRLACHVFAPAFTGRIATTGFP